MSLDALLADVAFKLIVREFVAAYKPDKPNEFLEPMVNRIFEVCGNGARSVAGTKPPIKEVAKARAVEVVQQEPERPQEAPVQKKRGRPKKQKVGNDLERMTPDEIKQMDKINKLNAGNKREQGQMKVLELVKKGRAKGLTKIMIPMEYSVSDIEPFLQANGIPCGNLGKSLYPTNSPQYWILDFESNLAGAMRL